MRTSMRASRSRILLLGASLLLAATALAATALGAAIVPARAALTPVNAIQLSAVAAQDTDPLSTVIALPVTAAETDATATLTFTVTGLPPGLTYSQAAAAGTATLTIAGTITAPGAYTVKVTVTDDLPAANMAAETFAWIASDFPVSVPATATSTHGTATAPVTVGVTDANPGPYAYSAAGLPPGLTIGATAGTITIKGRPTGTAHVYNVAVTVTDSTGAAGVAVISWTVRNKITVTAKAPRKVYLRVKVSVRPAVTDSDPAQKLTWSVSPAHPLPPGLSISKTTGLISGRPQRLAAPPTTVIATDAAGSTGSAVLHWVVSVDGYLDNPGTETFTAGQGKDLVLSTVDYVPGDKVTWGEVGLPAGMGFQRSTMMLYGWPGRAGTYQVTLTGHGSLGTYDTMTFKLVVLAATGEGPAGQVRLALGGECLLDPGGRTANGTRAELGTCAPGAARRWTAASDGTIRVNGRCLGIAGSGSSAGRPLELWSCGNANPRQVWTQGGDGKLVNPASGLCVTDPGSSRRNGTVPAMGTCHARPYEQWTLPAQPILTSVGGSCADDSGSSGVNGNPVDMFWCNGTKGQDWTFERDGTIRAALYGGKCVTAHGKPGASGARIELRTCSARAKGQRWTVFRTGALGSELSTGGVCLSLPGMTAANAAQLTTAKCTSSDPRVRWRIG